MDLLREAGEGTSNNVADHGKNMPRFRHIVQVAVLFDFITISEGMNQSLTCCAETGFPICTSIVFTQW